MRPLSARERRLVAVGLLLGAIALAWFLIVGPLVGGFFDRAAQRRDLIAQYQRNERAMGSVPIWRRVAATQRATAQRYEISAQSEQLAIEALKERLARLAVDEGFQITAIQDLDADAASGEAKVRADLQISLTQLNESLRRLETEGPYVVEYLSISADRALATGRSSRLAVRLEVSAPWRSTRPRSS
jgi:general secretion pathway protein M